MCEDVSLVKSAFIIWSNALRYIIETIPVWTLTGGKLCFISVIFSDYTFSKL